MAEIANDVADGRAQLDPPCDSGEVGAHLRRILDSPHFVHAPQLSHFLEHLVTAALEGRTDDLKEYSLGRDVFRRGESYEPRHDSIVRVQASILRKRLSAYYENTDRAEQLRIDLPKGGYVPQFVPTPLVSPVTESVTETTPAVGENRTSRRGLLKFAGGFAAGVTAAGATWLFAGKSPRSSESQRKNVFSFPARTISPSVWGPLLNEDLPIQLAFGCPQFFRGSSLYIRDVGINNAEGEATDRKLQELTRQLGLYLVPAPYTYTGVGEILGIYQLTQFVTHQGMESHLENIQLLTPESIRNKNLILVSSYRFQTVLDLLSLPKAFVAQFDHGGAFIPLDRREGEQVRYGPEGSGGISRSYGLISFWTKTETGGRVLSMSGITSWATQGTVMYITGEAYLRDLEHRLAGAFKEDSPGIQVLVEIQGRDDRAISVHYVTHRVL